MTYINETIKISVNIQLSIDWLLKSFSVHQDQGSASAFSLIKGWGKSYPETTGYIIPTLLNFAACSDYRSKEIVNICNQSGKWLLSIQKSDGSFSGYRTSKSVVFDTGQIIFGLISLYQYIQDDCYISAARRAADWLINQQEPDGSWIKHAYNDLPHSYHARVAWALLVIGRVDNNETYKKVAIKNLNWVIKQQETNGWFKYSSLDTNNRANLHTIAYTIEGLLEAGILLNDNRYIAAARKTADLLIQLSNKNQLASFYNKEWRLTSQSRCLVGLAQVALVWLRLFEYTNNRAYSHPATKVIDYLKSKQVLSSFIPNIKGALAGSCPITGAYMPLVYPNWSAKFYIDLLLKEISHQKSANYQG